MEVRKMLPRKNELRVGTWISAGLLGRACRLRSGRDLDLEAGERTPLSERLPATPFSERRGGGEV